jgi:predicted DNA-binding protein (MmcQ/YjbR family)
MSRTKPIPNSLEAALRDEALRFPDTVEEFPWGERVIKVRGKIFVFLRATGTRLSFSVKLPHAGAEALELGYVEPSRYGLGKHGWVTATIDLTRENPVDTFRAWVGESYRAVAPKRLLAGLDGPAAQPKPEVTPKGKSTAKSNSKSKAKPKAKAKAKAKRR